MKKLFSDWKLQILAFFLVIAAEAIGTIKFDFGFMAFSLFPMLFALAFGGVLGIVKVIPEKMMKTASPYIGIACMLSISKTASTIGPNLPKIIKAGPALILHEFGNLGTACLAIPVAVFILHMGRSCIGAGFSNSREQSIAVVASRYGLDSEEGIGVMGAYIVGTIFGSIFYGLFVSLLANTGIYHPYAMAMACGTGSASMMSAGLAACVDAFPQMADELSAYAATSNMLSSADGIYMSLFISLPLCEKMYRKFTSNNKRYKDGVPVGHMKKLDGKQ